MATTNQIQTAIEAAAAKSDKDALLQVLAALVVASYELSGSTVGEDYVDESEDLDEVVCDAQIEEEVVDRVQTAATLRGSASEHDAIFSARSASL